MTKPKMVEIRLSELKRAHAFQDQLIDELDDAYETLDSMEETVEDLLDLIDAYENMVRGYREAVSNHQAALAHIDALEVELRDLRGQPAQHSGRPHLTVIEGYADSRKSNQAAG